MPVYEFLCEECKTVFSFHSSRVDTDTVPSCPRCANNELKRQFSVFSTRRKYEQYEEGQLVNAFEKLAENIESEKAENIAGRLVGFAADAGVEFDPETKEELREYLQDHQSDGLKEKLDVKISADSCSFAGGDVFIKKNGAIYLLDEKLYDLH